MSYFKMALQIPLLPLLVLFAVFAMLYLTYRRWSVLRQESAGQDGLGLDRCEHISPTQINTLAL